MQDVGDATAVGGYGLTASVVRAEIGIPLAAAGNIVSGLGGLMELGINLHDSKIGEAGVNAGFLIGGELIDLAVKKAFPGPNPDFKLGKNLTKQSFQVQLIGAERLSEKKK